MEKISKQKEDAIVKFLKGQSFLLNTILRDVVWVYEPEFDLLSIEEKLWYGWTPEDDQQAEAEANK